MVIASKQRERTVICLETKGEKRSIEGEAEIIHKFNRNCQQMNAKGICKKD